MKKGDKPTKGVPEWAWYITWGIMAFAVILNIVGIVGLLTR